MFVCVHILQELVLYVLLRTRHDLEGDLLDKEDFLKQLQLAKVEAGIYGMELPELPELVEVGNINGISLLHPSFPHPYLPVRKSA